MAKTPLHRNSDDRKKHGMTNHRLYRIHKAMVQRCHDRKSGGYENYGKRGIKVCREWRSDKTAFFAWAFGNGYSEDLTIERLNNDKGYCPENCAWVTQKVNSNNRRTTRWLTFNGRTMGIREWCEELGFEGHSGIGWRLRNGWTLEEALSTPPEKR